MARNPLKLPVMELKFPTLRKWLKSGMNKPRTSVTQGGSSRKGSGAGVAATDGQVGGKRTAI